VQACAEERTAFCGEVEAGNARVFRCLVQNLGRSDFGDTCRKTILQKLSRRQENWKLDVNLRTVRLHLLSDCMCACTPRTDVPARLHAACGAWWL
jgi:hypothetical protein